MPFERLYPPQFRDADEDGNIGLRGYMDLFQDATTHHVHNLGKGNDTIIEDYGICWLYTKYRLQIFKRPAFAKPITLSSWIEKGKLKVILNQGFTVTCDGETYACGNLESCLLDMKTQKLVKLEAIDFPFEAAEETTVEFPPFTRLSRNMDDLHWRYTHQVRYTDLDKTRHVNNLRYISMLLNAFEGAFYDRYAITDFEINYLSQSFEGEQIGVYASDVTEADKGVSTPLQVRLAACHEDGSLAVMARFGITEQ